MHYIVNYIDNSIGKIKFGSIEADENATAFQLRQLAKKKYPKPFEIRDIQPGVKLTRHGLNKMIRLADLLYQLSLSHVDVTSQFDNLASAIQKVRSKLKEMLTEFKTSE